MPISVAAPSIPTASTPPAPVPGPLPPATLPSTAEGSGSSLRLRIAHWMESKLGRAYLPVAMLAGGAVGATAGMLTLGPIGALAGGAAGALLGGVLVFAG